MQINDLRKENELLDIFYNLAVIPSPSLKEDSLIKWIQAFCEKECLDFTQDSYGNVYISVPATDETKQPYLFSSHMDVVGDDSPINIKLDGDYWYVGDRTLGADDKAGVACALFLAKTVSKSKEKHGGVEIILTRDEESGMSGIEHVEFSKINSKYVLVLDADSLGQLQISGAGYTNVSITVECFLGGHSGIDIADKDRLNAVKLISELVSTLPQGVYYSDDTGVITSCNAGAIASGGIKPVKTSEAKTSKTFINEMINKSATNIINTYGKCSYSIRSASVEKELELRGIFIKEIEEFNKKYENLASAKVEFSTHLPQFEKSEDDLIAKHHTIASKKVGIKNQISSFHAGAETHIYCQKYNCKGEKLIPFLLGVADILNMHSERERIAYKSLIQGYNLINNLFYSLNSD